MNQSLIQPKCATAYLVAGMLLFLPLTSQAEFFMYKDDIGSVVITNKLEDIPKKYRNRVKVVWDKDLEAKDHLARRKAAAKSQLEQQEQQAPQKAQADTQEQKQSGKGKKLVITLDENTGEVIRKFE